MRRNSPFKDLFNTPQQKTYTLLVSTVLLVAVFFFFAIRPAYNKIAEINQQLTQKEALLKQINTKISSLQKLKDAKKEKEKDLHYFEDAFPNEAQSGYLVANFAGIADNNNLILLTVEFEDDIVDTEGTIYPDVDTSSVTLFQGRLTVSGRIEDIENYISDLEIFPRVVNIKSISYNKNSTATLSDGTVVSQPYTAQITALMFYYGSVTE